MNKNLESGKHPESFYFIFVLEGEINDLEEIERSITTEYIESTSMKLIEFTYIREDVCLVSESILNTYNEMLEKGFITPVEAKQLDHPIFACILFRETDDLLKFKRFIYEYVQNKALSLRMSVFLDQRMYIMPESKWTTYCNMKQK